MIMGAERLFLVGLSGSGKSTVGRMVAERLGWDFVDTDTLVMEISGRTIPELFREGGEALFREYEVRALREAAERHRVVVSTGGGAPTTPEGRRIIASGYSVWLVVDPDEAVRRLEANPGTEERPLLGDRPAERLRALLEQRRPFYAECDGSVDVNALSPAQVATEVIRLMAEARPHLDLSPSATIPGLVAMVRTPSQAYPVIVRNGALADVGAICRQVGLRGRAFVLSDEHVAPLFGPALERSLRDAGFDTGRYAIPAGEQHKTLATVAKVYDWLLESRVERSDFVVCLGGGVTTDLGGFAAATCLRGIAFVHVPTTLLAMADAAIGGKTGVDHPRGKNLIGAFAQPSAVVIDPAVLERLPERELRAGMAEVIKHGLILDEPLVHDLERAETLPAMLTPDLIARSVAVKARVVSADERELGQRMLLNYGHTVGHAIEAVTGYDQYLHGEAVAIGMHAAGRIAVQMEMLDPPGLDRQQRLIAACGLPDTAPGLDAAAIIEATGSDKKVRGGAVHWVLLEAIGRAVTRNDVPEGIVRDAVAAVTS
ncbi:MAG: hypothetical protein Kow0010_22130 [Dehalococcoidia bacterium]